VSRFTQLGNESMKVDFGGVDSDVVEVHDGETEILFWNEEVEDLFDQYRVHIGKPTVEELERNLAPAPSAQRKTAREVLNDIVNDPGEPATVRIAAAEALMRVGGS
jgi:PAS domain-containing protein